MVTIEHHGTKRGLTLFYFPNSRFTRLLPDQVQELCLFLLYFLTTWTIFETREERRKRGDTSSSAVINERRESSRISFRLVARDSALSRCHLYLARVQEGTLALVGLCQRLGHDIE